jgi:hypothetical protein
MTVTRLKRKDRKNLARAVNKTRVIKQLLARPVIKQVNMEVLNAKYGTSASASIAAPVAAPAPAAKLAQPQHEEVAAPVMSEDDANA